MFDCSYTAQQRLESFKEFTFSSYTSKLWTHESRNTQEHPPWKQTQLHRKTASAAQKACSVVTSAVTSSPSSSSPWPPSSRWVISMETAGLFSVFLLQQMVSRRQVEMKYGQKTTRWQKTLSTDSQGGEARRGHRGGLRQCSCTQSTAYSTHIANLSLTTMSMLFTALTFDPQVYIFVGQIWSKFVGVGGGG